MKVVGSSCTLNLEPAQTGSCAFPSAGTFAYTDPGSGFSGTVSVAPNSRSVSLTPSRTLNIFGDAVTLSGTVSSKAAGEKVTVFSRPAGLPETQTIVTTTAGGNWSLQVQPRVKTAYQAQYDTASSPQVTVSIRPRITLQKVGRHQYLIVVLSARSMAGKTVSSEHGGPVRMYVAPMYGYKSCKWLDGINVVAGKPKPGYWEVRGYDVDAFVGKSNGRDDNPTT